MVPLLLAFIASLCLGTTAVLLKQADVDSTTYGLVVRSAGSVPLVLLASVLLIGTSFLSLLSSLPLVLLLALSAGSIIGADLLIMHILRHKPVGLIAPLMAVFPLFTTVLLLLTGRVNFSAEIVLLTAVIVAGVAMVTYNPRLDQVSFDTEAISFGLLIAFLLGVTNFADVLAIDLIPNAAGLAYTSLKFGSVMVLSTILFISIGGLTRLGGYAANRRSTVILAIAGILAWGLGSYFLYTAYQEGDPQVVNAVIGTNPIFAVLISMGSGMEEFGKLKIAGLILCAAASVALLNL